MNASRLVDVTARAVRSVKYRTQGVVNGQRREIPPTIADRRYAVAASAELLRELAQLARTHSLSSRFLAHLAVQMEREGPGQ